MARGLWLSRRVFVGLEQGSPLPIGLLQLAVKNAANWVEVAVHTCQRHCGGHTFPARSYSSLVCGMHEVSCSLKKFHVGMSTSLDACSLRCINFV